MVNNLSLTKTLNAIEKEDLEVMLTVDEQGLVHHKSKIVGITGPPGAGKSTLLNDLIRTLYNGGETIAVLLIDPSDPYTKGAFLGDRIRLNNLPISPNIFVRSVASRGFLGGVSLHTPLFIKAFIAHGFSYILVETVGSGQNDVDINSIADATVYVTSPDIGDGMQALKGGSFNNFDLLVINKADLKGADRAETIIKGNHNITSKNKKLRLIKHQRGSDKSMGAIISNLEEIFMNMPLANRDRFVEYYQKTFLNYYALRYLLAKKALNNGEQGKNVIKRIMKIFDGS